MEVSSLSNGANISTVVHEKAPVNNLLLPVLHPTGKTLNSNIKSIEKTSDEEYTVRFHLDTQSVVEPMINSKATQINRWLTENGHEGFEDLEESESKNASTSKTKKPSPTDGTERYESLFDRLKSNGVTKNHFSVPPFMFYLSYTIANQVVGISDVMSFRDSSWINHHDIVITEDFLKSLYTHHVQIKLWQLAPARDISIDNDDDMKTARKMRRKRYQEGVKKFNPKIAGKSTGKREKTTTVNDDKLRAYISAQKEKSKPPPDKNVYVPVDPAGNPIIPEEPKPHHYLAIRVGSGNSGNSRSQRQHRLKRALSLPKMSLQKGSINPYDSIVSIENLASNFADGATSTNVPVNKQTNQTVLSTKRKARVRSAPFLRMHRPISAGSSHSRATKQQERWARDPMKPHPHHYDSPENTMTFSSWHSSKTFSSAYMMNSLIASVHEGDAAKSVIAEQKQHNASIKKASSNLSNEGNQNLALISNSVVTPFTIDEPKNYFAHRKSKYINPFMQHSSQKASKLRPGQEDHIYLGSLRINTNPLFGGKLFVVKRERNMFQALHEVDVCLTIDKPLIPKYLESKLSPIRITLIGTENMPCKKPYKEQDLIYEPVYLSFEIFGEFLQTTSRKPHTSRITFMEDFYLVSSWIPEHELVSTFTNRDSFLAIKVHDRDPKKATKAKVHGVANFTLDRFWDELQRNGKVKLISPIRSVANEAVENTWTESGASLKLELEIDKSLGQKLVSSLSNQHHYHRYLILSKSSEKLKTFMVKLYHLVTGVYMGGIDSEDSKLIIQSICISSKDKGISLIHVYGDYRKLFQERLLNLIGEFPEELSHYILSVPHLYETNKGESFVRFWNVSQSLHKRYITLWKEIKDFSETMKPENQPKKQIWDILFMLLFQEGFDISYGQSLIMNTLNIQDLKIYLDLLTYVFKEDPLKKVHWNHEKSIKQTENNSPIASAPVRKETTKSGNSRNSKNPRTIRSSDTKSNRRPRGDSATVGVFNYSIQKLNSVTMQRLKIDEAIIKDSKHVYAYGEKYRSQEYATNINQ